MKSNRSIPASTIIPVLAYPNMGDAVEWLCEVFGFTMRLRIGDHRAQLNAGDGAVVVTERQSGDDVVHPAWVMMRVSDVDAHHAKAKQRGARIIRPPADQPYGERQYSVEDSGGHQWTFSQSIADVAPEEWGGVSGQL
jgi:uncharacterized glyoxalase superfamily protein PhnB